MKYRMFLVGVLCLCIPAVSNAQILISEVAWMGTDTNAADEWIELYNLSASSTDITGWTLTSDDGNISIPLSGTITPHGTGLLERGNDTVIPGIPALLTYTGEMLDSGTTLTLKKPDNSISDQAPGGTNWTGIGGSANAPKKTAQRTRFGTWVTAAPTPGLDNAQSSDPVSTSTTTVTSSSSGGGGSSKKNLSTITIIASSTIYAGKPSTLFASQMRLSKSKNNAVFYTWNFGDMETGMGASTTHTFAFPGDYIVIVEATSSNKLIHARTDITVLPRPLSLTLTENKDIAITNESTAELTLDGYTISAGTFSFVFPKNSILKSKAHLTLARTKISTASEVRIKNTTGEVIAVLRLSDSIKPVTAMTEPEYKIVPAETPHYNTLHTVSTTEKKFRFASDL